MSTVPADLRYTETHEWVRDREKLVTVGITQFAADQLGPVSFVELPYPGELLKAGVVFSRIRSDSSSAALQMPFTGKIMEVNQRLDGSAELVNSDPYGAGWIVRMEPGDPAHVDALLDAAAYEAALPADSG